ncbi:MAG TPA: hypothetical protein VNL94_07500 [Candidatus Binatia bacterium]|nr:hypothetical protein [Candidatus Binatia bacterium]
MDARRRAGHADFSRTWALVPIRGLRTSKTRLGADLDTEERARLVAELLRRTLVATRDARRIAGAVVVTKDGEAAELAGRHRAIGLVEQAPGLNEAIMAARSVAVARGATAVLVLPADLPAVSADAIDALVRDVAAGVGRVPDGWTAGRVDATAPTGVVGIVPDRHGAGTNVLLVSPPELIDPEFGDASRSRHAAAARRAGATAIEVDGPLSLDVDTPADLLAAEAALGSLRG